MLGMPKQGERYLPVQGRKDVLRLRPPGFMCRADLGLAGKTSPAVERLTGSCGERTTFVCSHRCDYPLAVLEGGS